MNVMLLKIYFFFIINALFDNNETNSKIIFSA